jgi:hypothetical protein
MVMSDGALMEQISLLAARLADFDVLFVRGKLSDRQKRLLRRLRPEGLLSIVETLERFSVDIDE